MGRRTAKRRYVADNRSDSSTSGSSSGGTGRMSPARKTPQNAGPRLTKGGFKSKAGGYNNERQMLSGRKDHNDDDDSDGKREIERKCDRKCTAIEASSSSTRQRALLTGCMDTLLAQLVSLDMVRWTRQDWLTFRTGLCSLASLVNDVLGRVPEFLLDANIIAMKWIYIQDAIVPLRSRLGPSDPVMSLEVATELRYVAGR
jgi:hypothetical protein